MGKGKKGEKNWGAKTGGGKPPLPSKTAFDFSSLRRGPSNGSGCGFLRTSVEGKGKRGMF